MRARVGHWGGKECAPKSHRTVIEGQGGALGGKGVHPNHTGQSLRARVGHWGERVCTQITQDSQ